MELKLIRGDYVPDQKGGVVRCADSEALLCRVLFRLTAHRGQFPLLPELGSRLYLLGRESPAGRLAAARQYAVEALAQEPVSVTDLSLSPAGQGRMDVTILLDCQGSELVVTLTV